LFCQEFCCFDYRTNLPEKLAWWAKNSRDRRAILDLIVETRDLSTTICHDFAGKNV
jgi:hypothetical protein